MSQGETKNTPSELFQTFCHLCHFVVKCNSTLGRPYLLIKHISYYCLLILYSLGLKKQNMSFEMILTVPLLVTDPV